MKRILRDSPWAKVVVVPYSPLVFSGEQIEHGPTLQIGKVPYDPGRDPMAVPDAQTKIWQPDGVFILRWQSARTIRRALYRLEVLKGQKARSEPEAGDYQLLLVNDTPFPLRGVDTANLERNTSLTLKTAGRRLAPTRVEYFRDPSDSRILGFVFHFARTLASGEPVIRADEDGIDFLCQIGPRIFQAKFDPHKMVSREGRDL